jgi:hypothetical protein
MTTAWATSDDGLVRQRRLEPTTGTWDARGARVSTVLAQDPLVPAVPMLRSPHSNGAFRCVTALPVGDEPSGFARAKP